MHLTLCGDDTGHARPREFSAVFLGSMSDHQTVNSLRNRNPRISALRA